MMHFFAPVFLILLCKYKEKIGINFLATTQGIGDSNARQRLVLLNKLE